MITLFLLFSFFSSVSFLHKSLAVSMKKSIFAVDMVKHLYIIAGCNGAGKTTVSKTILPKSLLVKEFVNADEIAKALSIQS